MGLASDLAATIPTLSRRKEALRRRSEQPHDALNADSDGRLRDVKETGSVVFEGSPEPWD